MKPIFTKKVTCEEKEILVANLLAYGIKSNFFSLLETTLKPEHFSGYELIACIGIKKQFLLSNQKLADSTTFFNNYKDDWKLIQLNYNLFKHIYCNNYVEKPNDFNNHLLSITIPETTFTIKDNCLSIFCEDHSYQDLLLFDKVKPKDPNPNGINQLNTYIHFNQYLQQFDKIQAHLKRGDIYEINYCIPFFIDTYELDVIDIYNKQKLTSPAPFAAFIKNDDNYLMCASPEQFIEKKGSVITCHPMKGTIKKSSSPTENKNLIQQLYNSEKERAENVMIVDLTRNDLSKIAEKSSVNVTELFGVYEFPQVFQMISTIEAQLKQSATFADILKALFPMGSMTGAPKQNAIKIIDEIESFSRDLFSGSIGYMEPNGDFNFNVVIRSILYNEDKRKALVAAGGAITIHCNAEDEYKECLLKARANLNVLGIDETEIPLPTNG
ncbi:MAG: chorismate-binding protein [Bacteroidota bacterium]